MIRIFSFDNYKLILDFLEITEDSGVKLKDFGVIERNVSDYGTFESEDELNDPMIKSHKKFAKFIKRKNDFFKDEGGIPPAFFEESGTKFCKQYVAIFDVKNNDVEKIDKLANLVSGSICDEELENIYQQAEKIVCLHANKDIIEHIFGSVGGIEVYQKKFGA